MAHLMELANAGSKSQKWLVVGNSAGGATKGVQEVSRPTRPFLDLAWLTHLALVGRRDPCEIQGSEQ